MTFCTYMESEPIKILLIDSAQTGGPRIRQLLGIKSGFAYDIQVENSLASGLECASGLDFNVAVLSLAGHDNIDDYCMLRDHVPDLPVIIVTESENSGLAEVVMQEGAQDCFSKNEIDSDTLERAISRSLERKKAESALRAENESLKQKIAETAALLETAIQGRQKAENALAELHAHTEKHLEDQGVLRKTIDQLNVQLEERQLMSEALYESEEQFRSLVANLPGAVYRFRIDQEWTMEFISDVIEEITGYPPSFFIRNRVRSYRSIIHPDDFAKVEKAIQEGLDPLKSIYVEYRIVDANNNIRWFIEKGQAIFSETGQPLWLDGAIFDDSERKFAEDALQAANKELQRLAIIDGLTQIPNRRRFDEYLDNEWRRMKRKNNPVSLILCDIDFFKLYNDNYGHQEGDSCLQQVAKAIQKAAKRPADLAARYGGEEFAVILPDTDVAGAVHIAQQVCETVSGLKIPHEHSKVSRWVSLSLGVASAVPSKGKRVEDLIQKADSALYRAKEQGRNRVYPGPQELYDF